MAKLGQTRWDKRVARANTAVGDQLRDQYIADVYRLTGDLKFLWLPKATDTTTTTDESKNAHVITYDATIAAKMVTLGSGKSLTFDGTATEADIPDSNDFSLGDGAVDSAGTWFSLVKMTDATDSTVLAKYDVTGTLREWRLYFDANDYPTLELYDESADTWIGREDATAFTEGAWAWVIATYDGTGSNAGIRIYVNKARLDDTDASSGAYVAMENSTALVELGQITSGTPEFFDGSMAVAGMSGKALSEEEVAIMVDLGNSFFDLSI